MKVKHIVSCSRCGGDHENVVAHEFQQPFSPPEANGMVWSHWAHCPTNGDPILFIVTDDSKERGTVERILPGSGYPAGKE